MTDTVRCSVDVKFVISAACFGGSDLLTSLVNIEGKVSPKIAKGQGRKNKE